MKPIHAMGRSAAAAAAMAVALAMPLDAQGVDVTLVGETAGDDVSLFLAEGNWAGQGLGVKPVVWLQGYVVTFDAGPDVTGSTWSVTPGVGARYGMDGGFVQGKVGYSFKGAGETGPTTFFGGAEDGVNTVGHLEWWGTGAYSLQGIGSYTFGSNYLWSRARGTARVIAAPSGDFHVGAEAGWQGRTGDEVVAGGVAQPNYSAIMAGPVIKWTTQDLTGTVGAGWKGVYVGESERESTWYLSVGLNFVPRW